MQTDADTHVRRRTRLWVAAALAAVAAVAVAAVLYATLGDESADAQPGPDGAAATGEPPEELSGIAAALTERVLDTLEDPEVVHHAEDGYDHEHSHSEHSHSEHSHSEHSHGEDASHGEHSHAEDGHHADGEDTGRICEARAFGHEPQDAETVDEAERVYAQHFCAQYGTTQEWPRAIISSGPIAVDLTTDPGTVTLPDALADEPGADTHADRIRMLVPEEYHDQALVADGYGDSALGDRLRDRFERIDG